MDKQNNITLPLIKRPDDTYKFYGYMEVVSSNDRNNEAKDDKVANLIDKLTSIPYFKKQNEDNTLVQEELNRWIKQVMNANGVARYQLDIMNEAILPYLESLSTRVHVDKSRFIQIQHIIKAMQQPAGTHPAICLTTIDDIIVNIKQKNYLWASDLQTKLSNAVERQWQPIIQDFQIFFRDLSGKFLVLGAVTIVGWQMALLYPMYKTTIIILKIMQELEKKKAISADSLFDLAKAFVFMYGVSQIVQILSLYSNLGYMSIVCGLVCGFLSINKSLIKPLAPIISQHAVQVETVLQGLGKIDQLKVSSFFQNLQLGATVVSEPTNEPIISDRVEELDEDTEQADTVGGSETKETNDIGGIRRRRK